MSTPHPSPTVARATRELLARVASATELAAPARERLFALAGAPPSRDEWLAFLRASLLTLALAFTLAGVVFFFAYNWAALGRFTKLGVLEAAIVLAVIAAWRLGDGVGGRASLVLAAVLVGPLLAVYGQTYQTGADPHELFAGWAALVVPWAVLSRSAGLWLVLAALVNTGLVAYWAEIVDPTLEHTGFRLAFALAAVNGFAWAFFDLLAAPRGWLARRWPVRLVAGATWGVVTAALLALIVIDDRASVTDVVLTLVSAAAALGATLAVYRRRRPDLFLLALVAASGVAVIATALGKLLLDESRDPEPVLLLLAVVVVALVAGATQWLRVEARQQANPVARDPVSP